MVLGLILVNIFLLMLATPCWNSALKLSIGISFKISSFSLSLVGLTSVQQSLYLKNVTNNLLILFLFSIASENPSVSCKALFNYSHGVISIPCSSINCKEKSLAIHKNEGKASDNVSSSEFSPALMCICLVKLTINAKFSIACSSIAPIEF